jgi:hypothetical protein
MEDKAFKQIFACEVQFEQYKNFRVLAESLYEISHEAESVDTPYSAIISMLNYKPVDTRFPIYYEKTEEVRNLSIKNNARGYEIHYSNRGLLADANQRPVPFLTLEIHHESGSKVIFENSAC